MKYEVMFRFSGRLTVVVEAGSADEARSKAEKIKAAIFNDLPEEVKVGRQMSVFVKSLV